MPWRERLDEVEDLAPWEEIPLRVTLADRACAALPGSWRVAVTSLFPYSGTTTLAGVMGLILAGVRGESVLALDLHPGETASAFGSSDAPNTDEDEARGDSLAARVGSRGSTTLADIARRRWSASGTPADEVRSLIGGRRSGSVCDLDVLPVVRRPGDGEAAKGALVPTDETVTPRALRSVLGALGHAYPLILLDAPAGAPLTAEATRAADVVILVTLATAADLEAALADLRDPHGVLADYGVSPRERRATNGGDGEGGTGRSIDDTAVDPAAVDRPAVIAAVISPRRGRPSPRTRTAAARLARHVDAMVRVPYDPRLDPSRRTPVRIPRLRWATRRSCLRVAATAIDALVALADAEEHAAAGEAGRSFPVRPRRELTPPELGHNQQSDAAIPAATDLPRHAHVDHAPTPGVSFGDLRPGTSPTRVSGPDRPGGPPPAGKEP